jgi:glutathione S-transferase
MVEIVPAGDAAGRLSGVHLFHFAQSNCSQRVRMALVVKGVPWVSHHVDLSRQAHLQPDYLAINPRGLVPALVHDGRVHIESNDILLYIDRTFEGPALRPEDETRASAMQTLLDLSTDFQPTIKTLSHERLFRRFRTFSEADLEHLAASGADRELLSFMTDFVRGGIGWDNRLSAAERHVATAFGVLGEALAAGSPWLCGDQLSLADISWSVNLHRLVQCGVASDGDGALGAYRDRLFELPAFVTAVRDYKWG